MPKYTVKKGDTLSEIGEKFNIDWRNITGFKSGDPNVIRPGEKLNIPSGNSTGGNSTGGSSTGGSSTGSGRSVSVTQETQTVSGQPTGGIGNLKTAMRNALNEAARNRISGRIGQLGEAGIEPRTPGTIGSLMGMIRNNVKTQATSVFGDVLDAYETERELAQKQKNTINELRMEYGSLIPDDVNDLNEALNLISPYIDKVNKANLDKLQAQVRTAQAEAAGGVGGTGTGAGFTTFNIGGEDVKVRTETMRILNGDLEFDEISSSKTRDAVRNDLATMGIDNPNPPDWYVRMMRAVDMPDKKATRRRTDEEIKAAWKVTQLTAKENAGEYLTPSRVKALAPLIPSNKVQNIMDKYDVTEDEVYENITQFWSTGKNAGFNDKDLFSAIVGPTFRAQTTPAEREKTESIWSKILGGKKKKKEEKITDIESDEFAEEVEEQRRQVDILRREREKQLREQAIYYITRAKNKSRADVTELEIQEYITKRKQAAQELVRKREPLPEWIKGGLESEKIIKELELESLTPRWIKGLVK